MVNKLLYKIQDRIAVKFLKRNLSLEYAGKTLAIAYDKIIQEAIENNTSTLDLTYSLEHNNKKYNISCEITIKK